MDTREAFFTISADIASAHRLVKVRRSDWPLLGCRARADSKTIWCNKVGTFGISSSPYWWTRLFGSVGRLVSFILLRAWVLQLCYVDDLHIAAAGPDKFLHILMGITAYELLGTPFSYAKFRGGLSAEFVGYFMDYKEVAIGIVARRGESLSNFNVEMSRNGFTVSMRLFAEFRGRLGFVARVLTWLKPFLAPLYTWSAALDRSTVATAPKLRRLSLGGNWIGKDLAWLRLCSEKHIFKSKCPKHRMFGPLFEVQMWNNCAPLQREAHFQVKM